MAETSSYENAIWRQTYEESVVGPGSQNTILGGTTANGSGKREQTSLSSLTFPAYDGFETSSNSQNGI